jgi:hypothetical protein
MLGEGAVDIGLEMECDAENYRILGCYWMPRFEDAYLEPIGAARSIGSALLY